MKVLLASAPADYGYINLCYRYVELGEVAAYLIAKGHQITILDGIGEQYAEWQSKYRTEIQSCDAVILHHSGENLETTADLINQTRLMNRTIPMATYGLISVFSTVFFDELLLDAVVVSGDWEAILADWLIYLSNSEQILKGIKIRIGNQWILHKGSQRLSSTEWEFPVLSKLPLEKYRFLYTENEMIAGVEGSFELSFSVSKGCPYTCWYCQVPCKDGSFERRRSVESVVNFLRNAAREYSFDQVAFFSPNFTLAKEWVLRLCGAMEQEKIQLPWRCVTTQVNLDDELISGMAVAGCWRIGIGIETLNPVLQKKLGKPLNNADIPDLIVRLRKASITPMFFLLDGLPGQLAGEAKLDAEQIRGWGGEVRVSKLIRYSVDAKSPASIRNSKLAREVSFIHAKEMPK